ncbi:MAG TPA: DUF1345 domain-containing protein [Steroidobacteraceae bacterium]|jgi:uncharacterized membrane protein
MGVWLAGAIGVLLFFLLPAAWSGIDRTLTGWNAGVLVLMVSTWIRMVRMGAPQLRARYEEEDPTAPAILVAVVAAAVASIVAIVALLSTLKDLDAGVRVAHILLASVTIIDSWLLVPTMFTLHYADLFYSSEPDKRPLAFPQTPEPVFWDFVYFSFTIAAACQTADVATNRRDIRKTVVVHSLISFLFNLTILGFAINVTAGLLGGN